MPSRLVWFITGTSTGFGRDPVLAALERGEKVIATARGRSISKLDDLKAKDADILELDVSASLDSVKEVAKKTIAIHTRVDVPVTNAGYLLSGAIEEHSLEETTNVFGSINVARAFLPDMRERKTGTIIFLGFVAGWALYCSTKYATRGISTTMHAELSPLDLHAICVDPGYFRTNLLGNDNRQIQKARISDYQEMIDQVHDMLVAVNGKQPGDPQKGAEVFVDVVRGEGAAKGKPFPTVLALGTDSYRDVKKYAEETLKNLEAWKDASCSTDFFN